MKKKSVLLCLGLVFSLQLFSQTADLFQPYKKSHLRLPAVPLVLNDPYLSIWSPYDELHQGPTKHWTSADKPMLGLLKVDNTTYCFMGDDNRRILETILPMADEDVWVAPYLMTKPEEGWTKTDFDDSSWPKAQGGFGNNVRKEIHTKWEGDNTDIYVRRTFNLTEEDLKDGFLIRYSHDDVCEIFINGVKIHDTGLTWKKRETLELSSEQKELLHPGCNVIAVHCHNTTGGSYVDFGVYRSILIHGGSMLTAEQKSVDVMATNTYYSFRCGPVDLDVVFTAPMIINDYDLLSTPINYLSYQVRSTDRRSHNVKLYIATTPEMAMDNVDRGVVSAKTEIVSPGNGSSYARCGTVGQPVLEKKGDGVCVDWGYFYLSDANGKVGIAPYQKSVRSFIGTGHLAHTSDSFLPKNASDLPALAYMHDFGAVKDTEKSGFTMLGYDEVQDIEYMGNRYKAFWAHEGKVSIYDAFQRFKENYAEIMRKCREQDKVIYDDGFKSGGEKYAEILAGHYRLVIAAHKLFKDNQGNLLFFSKENNSNGSVNTVDLTYPSSPIFLLYNPELQKGMMTSIFEYSKTGKWTKPFACHDLGTYPIANGQTYNGDMPIEESGNMLILSAMLSMQDGNTKYVDKYWDIITSWNQYLVENGADPANQLCTDDFAGHWAHNCNLSIKAIMGIMGYSKMAEMKGLKSEAKKYRKIAESMAKNWEKRARDGDHYKLAFDRDSTWSQKYNLVWDKLWKTNIFPKSVMEKELPFYLTKQCKYGIPLDCRKTYTKNDWIIWTASMTDTAEDFAAFMNPVYRYINETSSRVPTSDWYDVKTGKYEAFIARSVIGGLWMKVLADKLLEAR